MKSRTGKATRRDTKPVEVVVAVTKFIDVLAAKTPRGVRGTAYIMKLAANDQRAEIKGDDIYIKRPAPIRFTFLPSAADKKQYYPVGITFLREGDRTCSDQERLGFLNFPQAETRPDDTSLTIVDRYTDRAKYVRYKFSLVIQRGSDGKIGLIDPGIVHEND
jgi:hypothetical protein